MSKLKYIIAIMMSMMFMSTFAQDVRTYIHPRAIGLYPSYEKEIIEVFPNIPLIAYPLALTEHESCVTLRAARCFNINSELRTFWKNGNRKELGLGLGQFTRAWRENGDLRMDALASLKKVYPKELGAITWESMAKSSDEQIKLILTLLKDDYKGLYAIKDPVERLKFTDSAYNGGRRDALAARKVCGLTKGCDPGIWFNHVEKHCVKSRQALYAGRSPCDINTHHVRDVFNTRLPKYQKSFHF